MEETNMAEIVTLTTENFDQEVLNSDKPVLVDLWASWCGPCKMLSPLVDQVAGERDDIKVGKIDVDDQDTLAAKFGVTAIPTLLVFKNGEVVNRSTGFIPKDKILGLLQ
jgi:thioredoxin 1